MTEQEEKTKLQFTLCVSGVGGLGADKQQNVSIQFLFVRFQLVARNKTVSKLRSQSVTSES